MVWVGVMNLLIYGGCGREAGGACLNGAYLRISMFVWVCSKR